MDNFEALIKAKLDASDFPEQIKKEIDSKGYEVELKVNATKLSSSVDEALKGKTFDVDITVTPTIDSSKAKVAAKKAAAEISTAINTGILQTPVKVDLEGALSTKGIDGKLKSNIIKSLEKDIGNAVISLKSMATQFERTAEGAERLKSIKFTGLDADGKTLTILSKIDEETGEISSELISVTQKFEEAGKAAKQSSKEFEKLFHIRKNIDSLEISIASLDAVKDRGEITAIRNIISGLKTEYDELMNSAKQNLSGDQLDKLATSAENAKTKVAQLQEIMAGRRTDKIISDVQKQSVKELDNAVRDLISTQREMNSIELKIAGTDKSNKQQIAVLTAQLENLKSTYSELEKKFKGRLSTNQLAEIEKAAQEGKDALALLNAKLADTDNKVSELDAISAQNKMKKWLEKNTNAAKDFGDAINAIISEIGKLNADGELTVSRLKELNTRFKTFTASAEAAGKTGKSFGDRIKGILSGFGLEGFVTMENFAEMAIDKLRDMYQQVYDIDTAMISLQKVTDETSGRYERFLQSSAQSAKDLGRSISSLVEQTASWAKLGYNLDEAEELAKLSSIYANVAEIGDEQAVSDMVTALRSFGQETDEAVHIVDSLNALSNSFAVTAGDLGTGLSRAASAMHAAGTDMNKTLAMITGGAEITQSANEFGNFMRTSVMRLRGKTTFIPIFCENKSLRTSIKTNAA